MSLVDPHLIRSERHHEIGSLLASNVGIILDRWSQRAALEQPNAKRVHHDVLLDHLTEFLQTLGRSLAQSEAPDNCQHCLPAAKHGEQRWDAGWSLSEVVRDYQILRLTILEILEESLDRPLHYRESLAIGLALDESISASVVVYVQEREQHLKSLEEKRKQESEEVQKQLQAHAASLQQADRRKNEFLAVLAHELRNPLAPVRNALHILKLKGTPDPELQAAREIIERQAQQMARMIDDLFDISRIAHGKVKLDKTIVSIMDVVERATEEVRPLMETRKHHFSVVKPPASVWLEADGHRLVQVLVNLLVNAAKYTDVGGQIQLTVECHVDDVSLSVRDSGIGIPSDLLSRIFEPFTQEQQSEDRVHSGLGIGLALVRNFVALHGGQVRASSTGRGHGSEFVVRLPILKNANPAAPESKGNALSGKVSSRRVLVVDDNRDAAHSLAMLLKLVGHEVQTAHDGVSALDLARIHQPEIILLDIGMPHMDGLEVGRRIRNDLRLQDVFLVALTGYGQEKDRRRSEAAGFNVHLVKPFELDQLHSILQKSAQTAVKKTPNG